MIRIAEVRFKSYVPGLTKAGNQLVKTDTAEMHLAEDSGLLLVRTKVPGPDFAVHVSNTDYLRIAEAIDGVFDAAPPPAPKFEVPKPVPSPKPDIPGVDPHPTPVSAIVNSIAEDTVRMVKIKGVIVERKGAPLDDELEELTKPRKSVAQMIAEADGAAGE